MKTLLNRQQKRLCICEVHFQFVCEFIHAKTVIFEQWLLVLASFENILIKFQTLKIEVRISPNSFSSIKCFKCRPTTIFAMHLLQIQCHDRYIFVRKCYCLCIYFSRVVPKGVVQIRQMLGKIKIETKKMKMIKNLWWQKNRLLFYRLNCN